jgi:hypothetical protein
MSASNESCSEVSLRLIAGEQPADDPALASHVGSCLRCFRTTGEMRDLPRIVSLLRKAKAGENPELDPGRAFWARFPGAVAAAWVVRRETTGRPITAGWRRLVRWLRFPIPAALAGAAVTAVLMIVVAVGRSHGPGPDRPQGAGGALADGAGDDEVGSTSVPDLIEDEDPWALLEMADFRSAVAQAALPDEAGDGAPTAAEEVELLDMDDLPVVAQALRGHSRI